MSNTDKKHDSLSERVFKLTDEQIESIKKEWEIKEEKRNLIIKKAKDKHFDLNKMFTETIDIHGTISTEDIFYCYEDKYKHLYSTEELIHQELDSICVYVNNFYDDNKMEYPPFYIDTYFGMDIYLRYNDELFRYFYMEGQGIAEGFSKGGLDKKVKYCLNLNTETVERI